MGGLLAVSVLSSDSLCGVDGCSLLEGDGVVVVPLSKLVAAACAGRLKDTSSSMTTSSLPSCFELVEGEDFTTGAGGESSTFDTPASC